MLFYLNNNNNSIVLFLLIFFLSTLNFFRKKKYLLIFFILLCITNIVLTPFDFIKLTLERNNNIPLSNGILLIHPFFIYYTYIYVFWYQKYPFQKNAFSLLLILYAYVAIFLGGFWAQQELNWGGWWNWDYVELIALIFLLVGLNLIHVRKKQLNKLVYTNNIMFYFFLFFIIVRCDILSSIHSFNSLNFFDKYIYYLFLYLSVLVCYFLFLKKNIFFKKYNIFLFNFTNIKMLVFILYTSSIVFYILYNIFIFFLIKTQMMNSFFFLKITFYILFFSYFLSYFSKTPLLVVLLLFNCSIFNMSIFYMCCLVAISQFRSILLKYIHLVIVFFFLLNECGSIIFFQFNYLIQLNNLNFLSEDLFFWNKWECFLGGWLHLNSYLLLKLSKSLIGGFFDLLYTNNISTNYLTIISYDLYFDKVCVIYKSAAFLFLLSLLFVFIIYKFYKNLTLYKVI